MYRITDIKIFVSEIYISHSIPRFLTKIFGNSQILGMLKIISGYLKKKIQNFKLLGKTQNLDKKIKYHISRNKNCFVLFQ